MLVCIQIILHTGRDIVGLFINNTCMCIEVTIELLLILLIYLAAMLAFWASKWLSFLTIGSYHVFKLVILAFQEIIVLNFLICF